MQYYCHSKDEMLVMAFEHVAERIAGRMAGIETAGAGAADGPVGSRLGDALLEMLPLDDRRRTESLVYLAFAARAAVVPDLAAVQQGLMRRVREHVAAAFRAAQTRGDAPDVDAGQASAATAALIDGLLLHLLTDPAGLTPSAAREIVLNHLRDYLPGLEDGDLSSAGRVG